MARHANWRNNQKPRLSLSARACLLDRPAEIGKFLRAEQINILADMEAGRRGIRRGSCGNDQFAAPGCGR
jgi:hypothetical protein